MKSNLRNSNAVTDKLVACFAAEKKKIVTAASLIAIMLFMWVRVLTNKGPDTIVAASVQPQIDTSQSDSPAKISFVDLPIVHGRNDIITRDFFTVDNWSEFVRGNATRKYSSVSSNLVSDDSLSEKAKFMKSKLTLQVIEMGKNPQTFINDKLLTVGDKLIVSDRTDKYECEVVSIENNVVRIRSGQEEIELKLAHLTENTGK